MSEDEADAYAAQYAGLIRELEEAAKTWVPLPGPGDNAPSLNWGYSPLVSISLKPTRSIPKWSTRTSRVPLTRY